MNPTLRGFLIIAVIAGLIVILRLQTTLGALYVLARIGFLLAMTFFVYLLWRERRQEISVWPSRAQWVFYGAALLIVDETGPDSVAFVAVLAFCGFAMWRTWREQHTYS